MTPNEQEYRSTCAMRPMLKILFLSMLLSAPIGRAQGRAPLHLERRILLPGVKGRIDHLSADAEGGRLFVAALGNDTIEVVDLNKGQRVHEITGLQHPQGVLYVAAVKRLYVASEGDGTLRSYDGSTYGLLKTVELGGDADNLRYDPHTRQVLVGYGDGGLARFDIDLQKVADVKLPSHPESFQLEGDGTRIFVNLPESRSIAVIDRVRNSVTSRWEQLEGRSNFPMALDEAEKRIFVGFRNPAQLLVLNTGDGKVVARLPIVGDADDLFYDAKRREVYVIGGEGFVDTFRQRDPDHYERISRLATSPGARTGLFVPALNRLFVAARQQGSEPAGILVYRVE